MKKRRWTCIDILKCLAAIAVVEIHKPLEIQGGDEFLILCRFAVPVFFMITGFFFMIFFTLLSSFHFHYFYFMGFNLK